MGYEQRAKKISRGIGGDWKQSRPGKVEVLNENGEVVLSDRAEWFERFLTPKYGYRLISALMWLTSALSVHYFLAQLFSYDAAETLRTWVVLPALVLQGVTTALEWPAIRFLSELPAWVKATVRGEEYELPRVMSIAWGALGVDVATVAGGAYFFVFSNLSKTDVWKAGADAFGVEANPSKLIVLFLSLIAGYSLAVGTEQTWRWQED